MLAVRSEAELLDVAAKLQLSGVPHVCIREVDPPFTGQCTAIGLVPLADRSRVKKIVSSLPLYGEFFMAPRRRNVPTVESEVEPPCASSSKVEHSE